LQNVIEKSFINWRVLSLVEIKTRISDTPGTYSYGRTGLANLLKNIGFSYKKDSHKSPHGKTPCSETAKSVSSEIHCQLNKCRQVKLCVVRGDIGLFQWHCKKIMAR
jgi:hypothetical protein